MWDGMWTLAPGYFWFLAAGFQLGGMHLFPIQVAQCALEAGTAVLVALLARRVSTPRLGLLAGLAYALYWPSVVLPGSTMTENLHTFLLTAAFVAMTGLVVHDEDRPRTELLRGVAVGLLFGVAGLARTVGTAFLALALPWLALEPARRRRWRAALGVVVGVAVVIGPWVVRNWWVDRRPVAHRERVARESLGGQRVRPRRAFRAAASLPAGGQGRARAAGPGVALRPARPARARPLLSGQDLGKRPALPAPGRPLAPPGRGAALAGLAACDADPLRRRHLLPDPAPVRRLPRRRAAGAAASLPPPLDGLLPADDLRLLPQRDPLPQPAHAVRDRGGGGRAGRGARRRARVARALALLAARSRLLAVRRRRIRAGPGARWKRAGTCGRARPPSRRETWPDCRPRSPAPTAAAPRSARPWFTAGRWLAASGRSAEALEAYRRGEPLVEYKWIPRTVLPRLLADTGRTEEAARATADANEASFDGRSLAPAGDGLA